MLKNIQYFGIFVVEVFIKGVRKLLKSISLGMAVVINILIICLWDFLSYILSKNIGQKHVDYKKFPFRARKHENKGNFYTENFNIDSWYKLFPIKYNRMGINSKLIEEADIPTLKNYLTVTCRSEFCSLVNCLYFLFAVTANVPYLGFIVGVIAVTVNVPFIFANRYVRFFLLNAFVKKRKQREILEYIEENNPDKYDLNNF